MLNGDESESRPWTKAELLERIRTEREALERTVGRLSDDELTVVGRDGWSVKDHLAHLAAWERGIAALLQRHPRYEAMGIDIETFGGESEDAVNAMIHKQHRNDSLDDVREIFRQAHEEFLTAVSRLADEDLSRTYAYFQPDEPGEDSGEPVVKWIAGNTYEHFAEHQEWIEELVG